MQKIPSTFGAFVSFPENRSALLAVQELAENLAADRFAGGNPLLLHGPTGTGKTHLVSALAELVTRLRPELVLAQFSAGDFTQAAFYPPVGSQAPGADATPLPPIFALVRDCDVLIVEDVQHLHASAVGPFTQLVEDLLSQGQPLLLTANAGPQQLRQEMPHFSARLISLLAGGVVAGVQPLGKQSRLLLLGEHSKHLPIREEVLAWLARNLAGGVRQLHGGIHKLEVLAEAGQPMDRDSVARQFQVQADSVKVTVETIARQVSQFFCVEPNHLRSRQRSRNVLVARQVGMYLAREFTDLSLDQIGAYFGGRDHSTVLHACRKVEESLGSDFSLSGMVRQLRAELV